MNEAVEVDVERLEEEALETEMLAEEREILRKRADHNRKNKCSRNTTGNLKILRPKVRGEKPKKATKEQLEHKKELMESMREASMKVLALPMRNEKKKENLTKRLRNSKVINSYLENQCYTGYIDELPDAVKFGAVYLYHFVSANQECEESNKPV